MDDALSKPAKVILGAYFGLMDAKSVLAFGMVESKPTPETQAALDELVAAGAISRKQTNRHGAVEYRPLVPTGEYYRWLLRHINDADAKFRFVEPIRK